MFHFLSGSLGGLGNFDASNTKFVSQIRIWREKDIQIGFLAKPCLRSRWQTWQRPQSVFFRRHVTKYRLAFDLSGPRICLFLINTSYAYVEFRYDGRLGISKTHKKLPLFYILRIHSETSLTFNMSLRLKSCFCAWSGWSLVYFIGLGAWNTILIAYCHLATVWTKLSLT